MKPEPLPSRVYNRPANDNRDQETSLVSQSTRPVQTPVGTLLPSTSSQPKPENGYSPSANSEALDYFGKYFGRMSKGYSHSHPDKAIVSDGYFFPPTLENIQSNKITPTDPLQSLSTRQNLSDGTKKQIVLLKV